jgi:hypothetical protein
VIKKTITVDKERQGYRLPGFGPTHIEVEAWCVDDVFAVWVDKDGTVVFAAGDDGNWWQINGGYSPYWMPQILEALTQALIATIPAQQKEAK